MADTKIERVTIEIETVNAAFENDPFGELARVLHRVANHMCGAEFSGMGERGRPSSGRDANGNTVARITYHEPAPEYTWADAREMAAACNARSHHLADDRLDVTFADGSHRIYDKPETAVDDMADLLADIDGSVDF